MPIGGCVSFRNDQNQSKSIIMIQEAHPALAPERRDRIRNLVREGGVARVEDLRKNLKVSVATIRRDLEILEEEGKVKRVHGGAVSMESRLEESVFDDKTNLASKQKKKIAEDALTLVGHEESVFLDGGSTTLFLARLLKQRTDITVVTNSVRAMEELADSGPRVIFTGGEFRRISQTMVGPLSTVVLEQIRVDKAFMGTMGFCLKNGITTTDPNEAYVKRVVSENAGQVILLADSTKADKVSFARVSDWDQVDILITDQAVPKHFTKTLRKRGIKVRLP
ncbi:MAG: DeoR family transcriptional regulator [Opitutae bacterium]|nr:DeoR family transcriptional regulator [Opitutae bacterium]